MRIASATNALRDTPSKPSSQADRGRGHGRAGEDADDDAKQPIEPGPSVVGTGHDECRHLPDDEKRRGRPRAGKKRFEAIALKAQPVRGEVGTRREQAVQHNAQRPARPPWQKGIGRRKGRTRDHGHAAFSIAGWARERFP